MQTLYFKNTLAGKDMATYFPCQKPIEPSEFVVEIVNIPDDVDIDTVMVLLNKTVVFKAEVIDYSQLGEGKIVNGWGGNRPGAGRKPPAEKKKSVNFYITETEKLNLQLYLQELRRREKEIEENGSHG